MSESKADIGLVGLAVMGENLAKLMNVPVALPATV